MDDIKRRVLVIAYHYPPLAGAGMLKILRTTRYLSDFGWDPLILTVKNPEPYHRADNPIPESARVYRSWRIPGGNFLARILRRLNLDERWLLLPDQYIFWIPGTLIYGWYLIIRQKVDLIYVTGPPYSALLCGALLKVLTGRPLVVDLRDPWSFNAARNGYPTKFHQWLDQRLEKWVLKTADFITCIYRITQEGYGRLYPWTRVKTAIFYDTIDRGDLPEIVDSYAKFTITYLGTFYPPFHTLKATLRAIRYLLDQGQITSDSFCFNYVGPFDKKFNSLIAELNLAQIVRQAGYQPLKEAQVEIFKSHALLLLLEFATINTKLFDYLAAGKPIIAVVPEFQELEELLQTYASRFSMVSDGDYLKIAAIIAQYHQEHYQGELQVDPGKREHFIATMNIERETQELTAIFNQIIAEKKGLNV
jgi:glycosyltransferase involved in cell wall biosynthesis